MKRRDLLAGLAAAPLVVSHFKAQAQDEYVSILDSHPKAQAVIGEPGSNFYVRFDRPIDHERSNLSIWQGDRLIERLAPRLESAPEVLFARAPTLPNGAYRLHWAVRTMKGVKVLEGDINFTIDIKR